jgi:hypothetical protein
LPRNKIVDCKQEHLQLENVYPFIIMKCDVEIDYAAVAMLDTGIAAYEQYRKG